MMRAAPALLFASLVACGSGPNLGGEDAGASGPLDATVSPPGDGAAGAQDGALHVVSDAGPGPDPGACPPRAGCSSTYDCPGSSWCDDCLCRDGAWVCPTDTCADASGACPASMADLVDAGGACDAPGRACSYGTGCPVSCTCWGGEWRCIAPPCVPPGG